MRRKRNFILGKLVAICLFIGPLTGALYAQAGNAVIGPAPGLRSGDHIPTISAQDQNGNQWTFNTLEGRNGLILLFSRSADWCPFCKQQLLELQQSKQAFAAKGIHVASVTYDSQAALKSYAECKGITYPMLSDPHSKIIRGFGILNTGAKGFAEGVPYPGIYYISADRVIRKRFFEAQYYNRFTPNDAYTEIFGVAPPTEPPFVIRHGRHVTVRLAQSDRVAGPGSRLELLVTVSPAEKTHVYAPGAEAYGYKIVKLRLDASHDFKALPLDYPKGTMMNFPILKESVPVYNRSAVLRQDIVMAATREFVHPVGQGKQVEITGTLSYQACNDHECFDPVSQPVKWTLHVIPLDFVRAPKESGTSDATRLRVHAVILKRRCEAEDDFSRFHRRIGTAWQAGVHLGAPPVAAV